jgi:hypothetical protein
MQRVPPTIPRPVAVRVVGACGAGIVAVAFFAIAVGGDLWALPVALVATILAVRALQLDFTVEREEVIVRNYFRTQRIDPRAIDQFEVETRVTNGGPTLVVRLQSGGQVAATAFPITRIPSAARRRRQIVDALNEWLLSTRAP